MQGFFKKRIQQKKEEQKEVVKEVQEPAEQPKEVVPQSPKSEIDLNSQNLEELISDQSQKVEEHS